MSPDFISVSKKIAYSELQTLWRILFSPNSCTIDDVFHLFFDPRSYGFQVRCALDDTSSMSPSYARWYAACPHFTTVDILTSSP